MEGYIGMKRVGLSTSTGGFVHRERVDYAAFQD